MACHTKLQTNHPGAFLQLFFKVFGFGGEAMGGENGPKRTLYLPFEARETKRETRDLKDGR
jgi:hypothetical protein